MKMKFLIKTIRVVFIAAKAAAAAAGSWSRSRSRSWSRSWNGFCCWCVIFNEGIYSWHFHFARKSLQQQQKQQQECTKNCQLIEPGSREQAVATGEGEEKEAAGLHRIDEVPAKQVSGHQLTHILSLAECNN